MDVINDEGVAAASATNNEATAVLDAKNEAIPCETNTPKNDYNPIHNPNVIKNLTDGFLKVYKEPLEKTSSQLNELTQKQEVLVEQLHNENLKVSWTQNSVDLLKMFDTLSTYQTKLVAIKKDMRYIHEKNLKLKKRAIRLQQHKEKVQYLQDQHRDTELRKERDLISKPAKPSQP